MLLARYHPGAAPKEPVHPGARAHWIRKLWYFYRKATYQDRWKKWYFGSRYYPGASPKGGYLQSQAWADKRAAVIKRDKKCCTRCGTSGSKTNPLQVHHTPQGYRSVGRESADSPYVLTLCKSCHTRHHGRGVWRFLPALVR